LARGGVDFEGIGAHFSTYALKTSDSFTRSDEGKAVTITGNKEAGYGSAGDVFIGVVARVEGDGCGSIQDGGYVEVGYVSAAYPPQLQKAVVVNGAGLVSQSASAVNGKGNSIVSVDVTKQKVIVLLG
jgi:hypothetical protein